MTFDAFADREIQSVVAEYGALRKGPKNTDDTTVSDILRYVIAAGGVAAILWLFRSRFAWLAETLFSALIGLFLIFAFFFNLSYLIRDPNPSTIYLTGITFVLPAFLLAVMWIDSKHPDPFRPVPQDRLNAFQNLINGVEAWGFRLETAVIGRGALGMASFVFVNRSDQIAALVVGNDPKRTHLWLYSRIAGHHAVLSTSNHGSGARPPGELRQWLPGKHLPELVEAHTRAADWLRSQGFTVGEIDEDPLDFLRFLTEIDRQNRERPGRYLLGVAFGDLLAPRTKPLAEQRNIKRQLPRLPT